MFEWHKKLVGRISERNQQLAAGGKLLVFLILGSMFAIELVRYGYIILIIGTVLVVDYVLASYLNEMKGKKTSYDRHWFGFLGALLLVVFLGIQTSQIPFKTFFLIVGIVMILPAIIDLLKR